MPTQSVVANHLDLSDTRAVRELRDRGIIPDLLTSDLDEIRVAYIRHLRAVASGHKSADGALDLTEERARLAKEQADHQELKNAEVRGELVPAADHGATIVALASLTAQRLGGVPAKAAPLAHASHTVAEAEAIIREHIDEARSDLADAGKSFSP